MSPVGDALVVRADALVDPRHQDPVRDEAGLVVGLPRLLAEVLGKGVREVDDGVGGALPDDNLHAVHDRDRVHEVEPDHVARAVGGARDGRDRQRRGVGREHHVVVGHPVEVGEDVFLYVEVLDGGLDDHVRGREGVEVSGPSIRSRIAAGRDL